MFNKIFGISILAAILAIVSIATYAELKKPAPLSNKMEAVVITTDTDGKEIVSKAKSAEPGEMIEYKLTYNNNSDKDIGGLVVTGPIPANTKYQANSALTQVATNFVVSIDSGKTYEGEPVKRMIKTPEGEEKEIVISPDKYTHVRWKTIDSMQAGNEQVYIYRVMVK